MMKLGVLLAQLCLLFGLVGCWKKGGDAIVLDKEYIAAAEVKPTPAEQPPETNPSPTPDETPAEEATPRPMKPNEIEVDGYVMEREVRGTAKDPRAFSDPQWLVYVELVFGGRKITVHAQQAQFEKLKPGDRVHVSYREGKYTGTIWRSAID